MPTNGKTSFSRAMKASWRHRKAIAAKDEQIKALKAEIRALDKKLDAGERITRQLRAQISKVTAAARCHYAKCECPDHFFTSRELTAKDNIIKRAYSTFW